MNHHSPFIRNGRGSKRSQKSAELSRHESLPALHHLARSHQHPRAQHANAFALVAQAAPHALKHALHPFPRLEQLGGVFFRHASLIGCVDVEQGEEAEEDGFQDGDITRTRPEGKQQRPEVGGEGRKREGGGSRCV